MYRASLPRACNFSSSSITRFLGLALLERRWWHHVDEPLVFKIFIGRLYRRKVPVTQHEDQNNTVVMKFTEKVPSVNTINTDSAKHLQRLEIKCNRDERIDFRRIAHDGEQGCPRIDRPHQIDERLLKISHLCCHHTNLMGTDWERSQQRKPMFHQSRNRRSRH